MNATNPTDPVITERRSVSDRRASSLGLAHGMTPAEWIPMLILALGGLNWGLIGLLDFNLVAWAFGEQTLASRVVYVAVGLCALYSLFLSARLSESPNEQRRR